MCDEGDTSEGLGHMIPSQTFDLYSEPWAGVSPSVTLHQRSLSACWFWWMKCLHRVRREENGGSKKPAGAQKRHCRSLRSPLSNAILRSRRHNHGWKCEFFPGFPCGMEAFQENILEKKMTATKGEIIATLMRNKSNSTFLSCIFCVQHSRSLLTDCVYIQHSTSFLGCMSDCTLTFPALPLWPRLQRVPWPSHDDIKTLQHIQLRHLHLHLQGRRRLLLQGWLDGDTD